MTFESHSMAAQHMSHHLEPHRRLIWCQMRCKRACQPSTSHPHLPLWKSQKNGQMNYLVASTLIVITRSAISTYTCLFTYKMHDLNSSITNQQKKICLIPMSPPNLWRQSSNDEWCQHVGTPPPYRHQVFTVCSPKLYLAWTRGWFNHNSIFKIPVHIPITSNPSNHDIPHLVPWLHGHSPQWNGMVLCVRHNTHHPQWCILYIWNQSM